MNQVIIAIDVGSSSVRSSAYVVESSPADGDSDNSTLSSSLASASCPRRSVQPNTGNIRISDTGDDSSLMDLVDKCMDETLQKLTEHFSRAERQQQWEVQGVGFSSFVMNLVGVDVDGYVVRDKEGYVSEEASISYACNTAEVAKEVQALKSQLGEHALDQLYQSTGAPIHSAYALAQLRVLYADPFLKDVRDCIYKWQTIASLCLARWLAQKHLPISYSEASWTGILNYRLCGYEKAVLDLLPPACRDALPELSDFDKPSILQGIPKHSHYWKRWPQLRESRFFLGLGDGACANVGSKCSSPGRIACTVGTSAAARVCLPCPVGSSTTDAGIRVPKGLFCYRIDRSHVLVGGALTDGGSVVEWASQLLNLSSQEAFEECMVKVEALVAHDLTSEDESSSVTMIPFLSGERSTGYRSGATGGVLGLTRETTPAHLLKSSLEGVTLRIAAIIKLIQEAIPGQARSTHKIIASGKALEVNSLWRQMLSDSTGLDVVFDTATQEGTSRGVACLVSMALAKSQAGASDSLGFLLEEPVLESVVCNPREAARAYWVHATANQDSFIDAVSPLYTAS